MEIYLRLSSVVSQLDSVHFFFRIPSVITKEFVNFLVNSLGNSSKQFFGNSIGSSYENSFRIPSVLYPHKPSVISFSMFLSLLLKSTLIFYKKIALAIRKSASSVISWIFFSWNFLENHGLSLEMYTANVLNSFRQLLWKFRWQLF